MTYRVAVVDPATGEPRTEPDGRTPMTAERLLDTLRYYRTIPNL